MDIWADLLQTFAELANVCQRPARTFTIPDQAIWFFFFAHEYET